VERDGGERYVPLTEFRFHFLFHHKVFVKKGRAKQEMIHVISGVGEAKITPL
jgi:hypothetical protein